MLGHVIVSQDFGSAVPEARRQQQYWTKYIDFSKIKAFVKIAISPTVEWGARNLVLGAGLGGMRPNIVVMGFYNLPELRQTKPAIDIPSPQPSRPSSKAANLPINRKATRSAVRKRATNNAHRLLPTDAMRPEDAIEIRSYVTIIEDLVLRLQANVAIGKGFKDLEVPSATPTLKKTALQMVGLADIEVDEPSKTCIDLWPIQMSTESATAGDEPSRKNVLTTNFDTYTLILQLGCILHTVPSWKRVYKLRVCVFVEYETDVEEERERVTTLLRNLRIEAEVCWKSENRILDANESQVLVFWLASRDLSMYEIIINGRDDDEYDQIARDIDYSLEDERWWQDIKRLRRPNDTSGNGDMAQTVDILEAVTNWPIASFQHGRRESRPRRFAALQKMLKKAKKRALTSDMQEAGSITALGSERMSGDDLAESGNETRRSSVDDNNGDADDDADDEALASESEAAVSDSKFDEYDLDASSDDGSFNNGSRMSPQRAKTTTGTSLFPKGLDLRKAIWMGSPKDTSFQDDQPKRSATNFRPRPSTTASDTAILRARSTRKSGSVASSVSQTYNATRAGSSSVQPPSMQHGSLPKFTSNRTPRAAVTLEEEEAPGPSIMFVDTPPPVPATKAPNPFHTTSSHANLPASSSSSFFFFSSSSPAASAIPATGFPAQQALPFSFNDLPCRAQHLILNQLLRQQSDDTAVVFTTLPSPVAGTCASDAESVRYISDLEVLCLGLPPVLLVHSNSMTVTMNL